MGLSVKWRGREIQHPVGRFFGAILAIIGAIIGAIMAAVFVVLIIATAPVWLVVHAILWVCGRRGFISLSNGAQVTISSEGFHRR